jgi:hypothetical protein
VLHIVPFKFSLRLFNREQPYVVAGDTIKLEVFPLPAASEQVATIAWKAALPGGEVLQGTGGQWELAIPRGLNVDQKIRVSAALQGFEKTVDLYVKPMSITLEDGQDPHTAQLLHDQPLGLRLEPMGILSDPAGVIWDAQPPDLVNFDPANRQGQRLTLTPKADIAVPFTVTAKLGDLVLAEVAWNGPAGGPPPAPPAPPPPPEPAEPPAP